MAACSCEPDRVNVVALRVAKILPATAAAFKPRRTPARVPASLACPLPLVGALSVYLSRRAGGDKLTGFMAALSPSIVMIPLWLALATKMSHPSPRQWFGLLCGVLNWIVTPGIALSLGAWPLLRTQNPKNTGNVTH